MKHWKTILFGGAIALATACSNRGGKSDGEDDGDGVDAADAADSTDGTADGTDSGDAADGTPDGTDGGDGVDGGQEQTIEAIQSAVSSSACDPNVPSGGMSGITVKGAIVTGGKYTAYEPKEDDPVDKVPLDGYYVSAAGGGANKGIQVTVPTSLGILLSVGDTVDIDGDYKEFFCNSQLQAKNITKTSDAPVPVPDPVEVTSEDLATPATAEKYEGVLVTVRNVKVESLDGYNYVLTGGARGSGSQYKPGYFATAGDELTSVTGLVDYSFNQYKIQPRGLTDIVVGKLAPSTETTVTDIQAGVGSTGCSQESGTAPPTQKKVRFSAIVVSPVHAKLNGGFVSTDAPGDNSGLFVLYPKDSEPPAVGDIVTFEGDVKEYFCATQVVAAAMQVTGQASLPTPKTVAAGDLAGAEPLEGTYVTLSDLTVSSTENLDKYNEIVVDDGLILVGSDYNITWSVGVGDKIKSVTGAVQYAFKNYRVVPFGDSAIEL